MRYILSIILTLGTLLPAMAQQKVLSLKECLEMGLEQNYDIRIVRNDERISSNNATVANAGMLPSLSLSSGYTGTAKSTETTLR
jgi:outer membrane protein TolC